MGRSPCCEKAGLKKGPWTPEEDQKLLAYIEEHGHGSWRALPVKAGLQRCGKSCRLRWTNYLRPDIKRGKFSLQEEQTIIQLHALLGNRWSAIATHLPKRTDNEIKNYWNTHLKKRLTKMGIDPVTHKPKNDNFLSNDGQTKNATNLSHMAQWESARLEAEARLVRESRLRSNPLQNHQQLTSPGLALSSPPTSGPAALKNKMQSKSLDTANLNWSSKLSKQGSYGGGDLDLESPTSTLSFSENGPLLSSTAIGESSNSFTVIDFVGNSASCDQDGEIIKEGNNHEKDFSKGLFGSSTTLLEGLESNPICFSSAFHDVVMQEEDTWNPEIIRANIDHGFNMEGFTELLLNNCTAQKSSCTKNDGGSGGDVSGGVSENCGRGISDNYEDNKNYWNTILNLVNSSPSSSPMF